MSEGYRAFEHTGDLGLEVWAATPERLHALAAIALQAQIIEAPGQPPEVDREIAIEGQDAAELLVHWLNTTLLEAELARAVWTTATVRSLSSRALAAILSGPPRDRTCQTFLREVKAVSHHALELDLTPGRCRCRVILDI